MMAPWLTPGRRFTSILSAKQACSDLGADEVSVEAEWKEDGKLTSRKQGALTT